MMINFLKSLRILFLKGVFKLFKVNFSLNEWNNLPELDTSLLEMFT
jgi:hypothetical protein